LQIKTKIVSCHTADSKPVKQEVNGTVILPPLVFPARSVNTTLDGGVYLGKACPRSIKTIPNDDKTFSAHIKDN
jgi:hypothetical protein